jgi:hypothetical protein
MEMAAAHRDRPGFIRLCPAESLHRARSGDRGLYPNRLHPKPDAHPRGNTPSPTQTAVPSTPTAAPTATPIPAEAYRLQPGSPVYLPFFRQPELGCAWTGVAGQIFDTEGEPVSGIVVVVEGALGDTPVDAVTVSGAAPAYGPGGYELQLGQQPIAAAGTLSLLLYDLDGVPLIQPLSFDTRAGCTQNLVLINFQQQ